MSTGPPRFAVLIPALNEAAAIRAVVQSVLQFADHVIVVDDGSIDGTAAQVEDLPIILIRHAQRCGKGCSLQDGFRQALRQGFDAVLTMDGDGQHVAGDIPRLLQAAQAFPDHLVIGARIIDRQQQPGARRFGNHAADWFLSWAAGQRIVDSQSGQRYYPRRALELAAGLGGSGFVFESEILIEIAWRAGMSTVSVPIASRYPADRRASHFRPTMDVVRITRMVAWRIIQRGLLLNRLWRSLTVPPLIFDPQAAPAPSADASAAAP